MNTRIPPSAGSVTYVGEARKERDEHHHRGERDQRSSCDLPPETWTIAVRGGLASTAKAAEERRQDRTGADRAEVAADDLRVTLRS